MQCQSFRTSHRSPPSYATVIPLNRNRRVTYTWLRQTLEIYRSTDDVFRDEFLSGVIFTGVTSGTSLDISPEAELLLKSLGMSWHEEFDVDAADNTPLPGPYVVAEQHLLEIFRLYTDSQGAFMNSLIPAPHT